MMKLGKVFGVLSTIIATVSTAAVPTSQIAAYSPTNDLTKQQQQQQPVYQNLDEDQAATGFDDQLYYMPPTQLYQQSDDPYTDPYVSDEQDWKSGDNDADTLNTDQNNTQPEQLTTQTLAQPSQQSQTLNQQNQSPNQRSMADIQQDQLQTIQYNATNSLQSQNMDTLNNAGLTASGKENVSNSTTTTNQKVIQLPYPRNELPHHGFDYPTPETDQYVLADYDEKWHLRNEELRRYNPIINALDGGKDAFDHGVKGLYEIVRHPVESSENIAVGLYDVVRHPELAAEAVGTEIANNTRQEGIANTIGSAGFEIASAFVPLEAGRLVGTIGAQIGERVGREAGQIGKIAAGTGVTLETTGQAAELLTPVAEVNDFGQMTQKYENNEKMRKANAATGVGAH